VDLEKKKGAKLNEFFPHGIRSDRRVTNSETLKMPTTPKESSQARLINKEPELKLAQLKFQLSLILKKL